MSMKTFDVDHTERQYSFTGLCRVVIEVAPGKHPMHCLVKIGRDEDFFTYLEISPHLFLSALEEKIALSKIACFFGLWWNGRAAPPTLEEGVNEAR